MQQSVRASDLVRGVSPKTQRRKRLLKRSSLLCGLLLAAVPLLDAQLSGGARTSQSSQATGLGTSGLGSLSAGQSPLGSLTSGQNLCTGPYAASDPSCVSFNPYGS